MPHAPHVIRLHGPWEYTALARTRWLTDGTSEVESTGPLPAPGRVRLPADWGPILGASFRGRVRYVRRFGCPTGLEPADQVTLVVSGVDAFGAVVLNSEPLGEVPPGTSSSRWDITPLLQQRNRLVVEIELPRIDERSAPLPRLQPEHAPGGLTGSVQLEILSPGDSS